MKKVSPALKKFTIAWSIFGALVLTTALTVESEQAAIVAMCILMAAGAAAVIWLLTK